MENNNFRRSRKRKFNPVNYSQNYYNLDYILAKNIKNINKILKVLEKSKVSSGEYDSTQLPFFKNDQNSYNFFINYNDLSNYEIPLTLNNNIILIYKILGDPLKELYLGEWTFFSLQKAIEIYKNYYINGQKEIFDVCYKYEGLGHITVLSCDLKDHHLFFRPDGGSNGYDREANFKKLINEGSSNYKKFLFSSWFFNIKT